MKETKTAPRNLVAPLPGRRSFDEAADGSLTNLILTLPRDVTGRRRVQVRCSARLSSRQTEGSQTLLMVEIETYEFLSSSESEAAPGERRARSASAAGGGN